MNRYLIGLALLWVLMGRWAKGHPVKLNLQITFPRDQMIVAPGTSVTVKIAVRGKLPPGGAILVVGQESLGTCLITHPPYACSIGVESDTEPGLYTVRATSAQVESESIYLDVERKELPVEVELGASGPIYCLLDRAPRELPPIYATYPDGTRVDISQSTQIRFTSEDPTIARVVKNKRSNLLEVVGIRAGSTRILINDRFPFEVVVRATER